VARNLYVTYKRGEVGKQIDFLLEDADGPFNLDNWTVTLAIAADRDAVPVVTGQTVTKLTQTGDDIGRCYHTLDATTANIAVDTYKAAELKLTNGSNVLYWPVDRNDSKTYFTVEVQTPIS
jgi:hypothetical protein